MTMSTTPANDVRSRPPFLRRALLLLAVAIVAGACAAADPAPGAMSVRLMSYNIAAGGGDLGAIARTIRSANADIVALQEVDVNWSERSGFADQAAELGRALGMHVRFGPIYSLPAGSTGADTTRAREFGVAILTRETIVSSHNHVIPRLSTQGDATEPQPLHGFLEAVTTVRGTRIRIFDTHLDYRADPRVRAMQVAAMLDLMRGSDAPYVLMGDLNAPPDAPEIQPLLTTLRDAWAAGAGPGLTYPASAPERRIDYILLSPQLQPRGARVPDALASDHRPVVADVLLTGTVR